MGNVQGTEASSSLRGVGTAQLANMLTKEHPAFEAYAEKLYHGDKYLSVIDGDFILSLDLDYSETDRQAFHSLLDALDVKPAFLRKSIENVARRAIAQEHAMTDGIMFPHDSLEMTYPTSHSGGNQDYKDRSDPKTPEFGKNKSWADMEEETDEEGDDKTSARPVKNFKSPTNVQVSPKKLSPKATPWETPEKATVENKPKPTFAQVVQKDTRANNNKTTSTTTLSVQLSYTFLTSHKTHLGAVIVETDSSQVDGGCCIGMLEIQELTLEAVEEKDWARLVKTNAHMKGKDESSSDAMAKMLGVLGQYRKAAYGRFRNHKDGKTGILVVSYKQPMSVTRGSLVCRIEADLRRLEDCPLEPLVAKATPSPKAWARLSPLQSVTKDLSHKFTRASDAETKSPSTPRAYSRPSSLQAAMAQSLSKTEHSTLPNRTFRPLASPTSVVMDAERSRPVEQHMTLFRHDLNESLVETFADDESFTSNPVDWLEARDIWNRHEIVRFTSLSVKQKQGFIDEVSLAVDLFNTLFDKQLVVHRGTPYLDILKTVTIYRDAGCKAKQHRHKSKICKYWLKNSCAKGDACPFAHGHQELVP